MLKWPAIRRPSDGLPRLWVEVVVLGCLYAAYSATRSVADGSVAQALRSGRDILRAEQWSHLDLEVPLNHWLEGVAFLAVICCYYYATLHFIITPATLIWMYRKHPDRYSRARWVLVITTLACLVGFFLVPTAPPRTIGGHGFVDTMAHFHNWGWWAGDASAAPRGLGGAANQFAALPSLHCAWALWVGVVAFRNARTRIVRTLAVLYPAGTAFVVMGTANHYFFDAAAGWTVLGAAALAVTLVTRRRAGRGSSVGPAGGSADAPAPDAPAAGTGFPAAPGAGVSGPATAGGASDRVREPAAG